MALDTPIALCIFNRPQLTAQVLAAIGQVRPRRLLVIGDGPRADRPGEASAVARARQVVEDGVTWECQVETHYSVTNLGCRRRMASGLDWAFAQAEELIVLEDDCLPDPAFFDFCQELLPRYRHDQRVMMISGDNFQPGRRTDASYYFSRWAHIWGWASWRRAWQHFDLSMESWPRVKAARQLRGVFGSQEEYDYWEGVLDQQHAGLIDTWDFPWAYACWVNHGLTILPEQNLVSNLGFGPDATHTMDPESRLAALPTGPLPPMKHPTELFPHHEADQYTWETVFRPPALPAQHLSWFRRVFSRAA